MKRRIYTYHVRITLPTAFPGPTGFRTFIMRTVKPWQSYALALAAARRMVQAGTSYMVSLDAPTVSETGRYRTHTYSPLMVAR